MRHGKKKDKKNAVWSCAVLFEVYAGEDGFDSSGTQDEILHLNAKEKVAVRKIENKYCI